VAASGRLDPAFLRQMKQTITVHPAATTGGGTDEYGEQAVQAGARSVQCYLAPFESVEQTPTARTVVPTWMIYANDIDIDTEDKITLPGGTTSPIDRVETYYDNMGKLYQVVAV
jgi:hypothetical protein